MIKEKKIILGISLIALIGFLFILSLNILEQPEEFFEGCEDGICMPERNRTGRFNVSEFPERPFPKGFKGGPRKIPLYRILLSPLLLIIAVVPLSYYFISKSLERKLEKNLKLISKLVNKGKARRKKGKIKEDKSIILKFLNFNERKALKKLIEEGGEVLQSEISRMEGMNKLKTHRVVKDLKMKGIIKIERYGKTNKIILVEDVKDILLK